MKKFFSLVLALVMVMGLTTAAWGALAAMPIDGSSDDADGTVNSKIVLNDDVVLTSTYEVAGTLTIDLNGHTISGTDTTALYSLIHVKNGANLTIEDSVGTGKISYAAGTENKTGVAVWVEGALTLESGTIEITGDWVIGFAVDVRPNAWGTAYTEAASFTMDGGKIVASDSGVRVTSNSSDSYPNLGVTFTMNGGTIDSAYDGIFVQNVSYDDTLTVGVVGGTVTSENTHAVRIYGNSDDKVDVEMSITGGSFTGKMTNLDQTGTGEVAISGGTFTDDVSEYVADGKQLLANGTVVTTPAAGATDPVLYKWDNAGAEWDAYFIATGKTLDKLAQDSSDDCLPCYLINGEYFVEVKEAAATYKLVYGAKTVFLAPVAEKLVKYEDTASVLTVVDAEDAECGDYYVTNLDEDDVYYISYNKKGEVDGIYVAKKNGSVQILVGNKIVNVEDAFTTVKFLDHDWEGYEVVNKAYVSVKCSECDKVAKLYANATAAGKKAVPVLGGWITFADAMDFGANAPVVDTKVESAETFDAGIAMYVGMSVMAAAGSAVVIGKKKD